MGRIGINKFPGLNDIANGGLKLAVKTRPDFSVNTFEGPKEYVVYSTEIVKAVKSWPKRARLALAIRKREAVLIRNGRKRLL